jgi:hypothetical protein
MCVFCCSCWDPINDPKDIIYTGTYISGYYERLTCSPVYESYEKVGAFTRLIVLPCDPVTFSESEGLLYRLLG